MKKGPRDAALFRWSGRKRYWPFFAGALLVPAAVELAASVPPLLVSTLEDDVPGDELPIEPEDEVLGDVPPIEPEVLLPGVVEEVLAVEGEDMSVVLVVVAEVLLDGIEDTDGLGEVVVVVDVVEVLGDVRSQPVTTVVASARAAAMGMSFFMTDSDQAS